MHRTQVLTGKSSSMGICSCGWCSPELDTTEQAKVAAADHVIDELKAKGAKIVKTK